MISNYDFDFEVEGSDGKMVHLNRYRGRVLLIVNIARNCGFANQFDGLEDRRERIDPRAEGATHLPPARRGWVIAVMSGRLLGHTCSPGRRGQWSSRLKIVQQPAKLAIRNHRIPPSFRE